MEGLKESTGLKDLSQKQAAGVAFVYCLLHADFLLRLLFGHEDGFCVFFRNVSLLSPHYTVVYPRNENSLFTCCWHSSFSDPRGTSATSSAIALPWNELCYLIFCNTWPTSKSFYIQSCFLYLIQNYLFRKWCFTEIVNFINLPEKKKTSTSC
jgi:hypothetical protein